MALSLRVFDGNVTADSLDSTKSHIVYLHDQVSCAGDKAAKCAELESALISAIGVAQSDTRFAKYKDNLVFAKVNKDDFPDHKKEFEKAKLVLPTLLFWPAGYLRPSCKLDTVHPTTDVISGWLAEKLHDEDASLLQLESDPSTLVCKVEDHDHPIAAPVDVTCSDLMAPAPTVSTQENLLQVEKTQKIWDFGAADTKFIGPADNSLKHTLTPTTPKPLDAPPSLRLNINLDTYVKQTKQQAWQALYFHAPWCHYCDCLPPVWQGVANNLVGSERQPHLLVSDVDGDANPELRNLFNVTVYPTFIMVNRDGSKQLGRYLGPRKVFELSNWIEDLIVADENPIVKHQFEATEQGSVPDLAPVFPYQGTNKLGQALASVSVGIVDDIYGECLDTDERKETPGSSLLVEVHTDSGVRALEMDINTVSLNTVPIQLTVVDFFAPWCGHCQHLAPVWDQVSSHFDKGEVIVGKVDTEAHPDVKNAFGIHRFPTIMYFAPGAAMQPDESRRYTGPRDEQHLVEWIQKLKSQTK